MEQAPDGTKLLQPNGKQPVDARALSWRGLAIIGAVYAVVVSCYVVWRAERSTDFRDFWKTAQFFRQTGVISSELGVHNYLPIFTLLMTPWSLLPLTVAIVLFTLLSLGLFAATVVMAERLLCGELPKKPRPATLVAISLILPYLHSCVTLGQLGLVLLFLMVAALAALQRRKDVLAGGLLGLAMLLKILPGALLVFCLLRGRFQAALSGFVLAAFVGLALPAAVLGIDRTITLHREYFQRAVEEGGAAATLLHGKPIKAKYNNNAAALVLRRWLSPVDSNPGDDPPIFVNVANFPRPVIATIYGMLFVLVLGTSVWFSTPRLRAWVRAGPADDTVLFGAWCGLMLLLSPLVWTHYLVMMYWPVALLVDRLERTRGRQLRLAGAALVVWISAAILLAWPAARAAGAQIISVAVVWGTVLMLAGRAPEHEIGEGSKS